MAAKFCVAVLSELAPKLAMLKVLAAGIVGRSGSAQARAEATRTAAPATRARRERCMVSPPWCPRSGSLAQQNTGRGDRFVVCRDFAKQKLEDETRCEPDQCCHSR